MKHVAAILALVLGIAVAGQVHAALDLAQIEQLLIDHQEQHDFFNDDMEAALEALADGDPATAKTKALDARAKLVQADNLIAQAKLDGLPLNIAIIGNLLTDSSISILDLAILQIDDVLKTKSQLATSMVGASFRAARANGYLQRSNRSLNRVSLLATGPSLHTAGKKICWTVLGVPAGFKGADSATCPLKVEYINPFGSSSADSGDSLNIDPIQEDPFVAPFDSPCKGRVCFLMGRDLGGGRIEIKDKSTSEVLARRLVFNYGSNTNSDGTQRTYPSTGQPLATLSGVSQFQGSYTGNYSGTCTLKASCFGGSPPPCTVNPGTFNSTLSTTGKIFTNVDLGGSGTGTMSATGTYATGSIGVPFMGTTVGAKFTGAIINTRDNSCATARGSWTASSSCGSGGGTWTAERSDCP